MPSCCSLRARCGETRGNTWYSQHSRPTAANDLRQVSSPRNRSEIYMRQDFIIDNLRFEKDEIIGQEAKEAEPAPDEILETTV